MRALPPTIRRLYDAADKLKITIPADIRRDLDKPLTVVDRAETAVFDGPAIGEAVTAAFMADRDPVTDPAVLEAIVRDKLNATQTINQIVETGSYALHDASLKHLDRIVEAFKPTYDKAGAAFTEAVERLTAAGITELDGAGGGSLELARLNIQAREAAATMQTIATATGSLIVTVGRVNGTPVGAMVNRLDTGDTAAVELINTLRPGWTTWDAVNAGYTPSLATPTEADNRAARAYEGNQTQANNADKLYRDALRKTI